MRKLEETPRKSNEKRSIIVDCKLITEVKSVGSKIRARRPETHHSTVTQSVPKHIIRE